MTEDQKELLIAFGAAMLTWQEVEEHVFFVFAELSGMQHQMSTAVFYSVSSLHGRVRMTTAAAEVALASKSNLLAEWKILAKRVRTDSEKRNALGHGMLCLTVLQDGSYVPHVGPGLSQAPVADDDKWTTPKISNAKEDFDQLLMDLIAFEKKILD